MKNLSIWLPPFAADYSGVCSAVFDYHCLVIINDAACCTRNYVEYEEPRWSRGKRTALSSELRTVEVVMGDERRIIDNAVDAIKKSAPEFSVILGTPVTSVVGMDMDGIAKDIEKRTGVPCIGFSTSGFEHYDRGVSSALISLIDRFGKRTETIANSVNILGITPFDFGLCNVKSICSVLTDAGFKIGFVGTMDSDMQSLQASPNSAVNLVVSISGLKAAQQMERMYSTPWVCGVPIGKEGTNQVIEMLHKAVKTGKNQFYIDTVPGGKKTEIIISADQVVASSLRASLRSAGCDIPIGISSFFSVNKAMCGSYDVHIPDEASFCRVLTQSGCTTVIGDPLLKLIPYMSGKKFISLPQSAISDNLYMNDVKQYVQMDIQSLISQAEIV